jgi:hypothetical protein
MILGRTEKLATDRHRVVVDLYDWLDPGEGISDVGPVTIGLDSGAWADTPFSDTLVVDVSPLSVFSTHMMDANTKIVLLLDAGTPELVYLVTFTVTGGTSGRIQTVALTIAVHEPEDETF